MDYIALANAAIGKRSALMEQRKQVIDNTSMTDADKRSRVEAIDKDMASLADEAEGYIRSAELQALQDSASVMSNRRADSRGAMEWRALLPDRQELRALQESVNEDGGHTVPTRVSSEYIALLRQRSVLLRAPGINVIPFDTATLKLPQLTATTGVAGPTPEGTQIAEGDTTWAGPAMPAHGYKTLHRASAEILMDSAVPLRTILADTMTRDIAQRIDLDGFGSASSGRIKGLTATGQHTKVSLAAGNTKVKWDDVVSAVSDIEANGGQSTVIYANGEMAKALRLERDNAGGAGTGQYMTGPVVGDPAKAAQGLPILASNNVPARSVIVGDMTRVYVGLRSTKLSVSEDAYFEFDQVGFRLVHRAAGLVVAESTSVIWIEAAAS